jgi:long-chain fatty acid transport protein
VTAGLLALLCGLHSAARAQEGPYENFIVGRRALGLGGAYVAVADDPGAIFHNPGGLASVTSSSASGSLLTIVRGSRTVKGGYRTDLGRSDLTGSASLEIPSFISGLVKFGRAQSDGVRTHAIGAAIFAPHRDEYRFVAQLRDPEGVDRLEVRHDDHARWYGIAYALRVQPGLSFGLSTFLAQRSYSHDEVELNARTDEPADSTVGSSHGRASTLDIDAYHLIPRFGVYLDLTRELRAGVMIQPPGVKVWESIDAERVDISVGPGPTRIDTTDAAELSSNLPVPWETRFGVTWFERPVTLVTLDVSIFGPAGDASDPLPLVENAPAEIGVFVPAHNYRRLTVRAALGFETEIGGVMPINGGIFYERSSAPEVLSTSEVYVRDQLDTFGGAMSLDASVGDYELTFGLTGRMSSGEGLAYVRGSQAPPRFRATDVENASLVFFVGGASTVVRRLVKTLISD